ncbi:MAG: PTS mannitol transporter subunit IICBA [Clostridiales bacterium]
MNNLSNSSTDDTNTTFRERIQEFGRFLSGMVMPNIGALIAWGLITSLFIPSGWLPNEFFAKLVDPMILYLLPILIGYSGGYLVDGNRGAVTGAIATMGAIVSTDRPMFMGAMIMGPLAGYTLKKFHQFIKNRIPTGFEMVVNTFSSGIIGMLLLLIGYTFIGPLVDNLSNILKSGVEFIVNTGLLPLTSIIIEPAKILFLNNAINHGVLAPLGLEQVKEVGKSLFFLLEANPGPGLGILMAYTFFGSKTIRKTAPGVALIHFFGGIHEVYFPYVLMNPKLILAAIAGGASGVFTFNIFNVGLVATPAPGSIFAILAMTPKGNFTGIILGVIISTIVSFFVASILLKVKGNSDSDEEDSLEAARKTMLQLKGKNSYKNAMDNNNVKKIIFACDAGMGSSALGASTLRNKFKKANINIEVENFAINEIPGDSDLVISHEKLTPRAKSNCPNAEHLSIKNFIGSPLYDQLVERFSNSSHKDTPILKNENIVLAQNSITKEESVKMAGKLLLDNNYIEEEYIDSMLQREKVTTTYIGNGIAIPHGLGKVQDLINNSGIVILQFPDGIIFGDEGEKAYLVIGIAAKGNEHIDILTKIALIAEDKEKVEKLFKIKETEEFLKIFSSK